MIFVTVGSREYPFDRLLMKLDDLCAEGRLPEPLFAQIGQSPYVPKHYDFVRYLDTDAFYRCQSEASLVISHAGTGALIGALKRGRQVVSVPRRKALGEHIDDHQLQVSEALFARCWTWTIWKRPSAWPTATRFKSATTGRATSCR